MNRAACNEKIKTWMDRRSLVHGRCLYKVDKSTTTLRDLTPREKRYFFLGKVPYWRNAMNDDR